MIKGWNYAGEKVRVIEPSFPSQTRGLISGLVPHYRLPYTPKLSFWTSSCIPCRYLSARLIPSLYHYGHELNCQIFLTIYFCTRFFCDKKFCINIFCVTKFCSFISPCVVSLQSKINAQIFVTQTIGLQKILMQKIMLQKWNTNIFVDLFL